MARKRLMACKQRADHKNVNTPTPLLKILKEGRYVRRGKVELKRGGLRVSAAGVLVCAWELASLVETHEHP